MKNFSALILSAVIFVSCCLNVSANNIYGISDAITLQQENTGVTPRYTHITSVSAGISEEPLGFVTCTSSYTCVYDDYTFTLTCTLQRTDGSTGWATYKTSTETFTETGTRAIEKLWFAPAGYAYRTYTTIVVKNSRTSKVVETATCDSPVLYK